MGSNAPSRVGRHAPTWSGRRWRRPLTAVLLGSCLAALPLASPEGASASAHHVAVRSAKSPGRTSSATSSNPVWLCHPGAANDPCASGLAATVVSASGARHVDRAAPAGNSPFDCFYVYPTVSTESSTNADLTVQTAEIAVAEAQASRFSTVCRVWAPMYRQVTLAGLATQGLATSATAVAYDSLSAAFSAYLAHFNNGRPIVFLGHSQGAAMLILLLRHFVDTDASLRSRVVLALIMGGNVEVPIGRQEGGSFAHVPVCSTDGESGCVIAYSSFPGEPPARSIFGRPGQGVSLQSGQTTRNGLEVVCVNPASVSGGGAALDPYFPSEGATSTPWVEYPDLYRARCESTDGATWLNVTKISPSSDPRPVVSEAEGPNWGYHADDVNLALGDLVADTAAAERSWLRHDR